MCVCVCARVSVCVRVSVCEVSVGGWDDNETRCDITLYMYLYILSLKQSQDMH